jgi:cytochrome c oxidase cbb3-type subunit III
MKPQRTPTRFGKSRHVAVVVSVLVLCAVLAHVYGGQKLKARFLLAPPDRIAVEPDLLAYALPQGHAAFDEHCAGCHGIHLHGDPTRGVPDLVDHDWLYGTGRIGEIERVMLYGIRSGNSKGENLADMPAFATPIPYSRYAIEPLTRGEVADVVALIYSFQHRTAVDATTIDRGSAIYHGKGFCFDCHGDNAKGDSAIGAPNLTDGIWLYGDGSMDTIRRSVERGLRGVCPAWISRLPPDTIRSIAVYINSRPK